MQRRAFVGLGTVMCLAGCTLDDTEIDETRAFSDFTIINKTDDLVDPWIAVRRNDKLLFGETIDVQPTETKQLIQKLDQRDGFFEVSAEYDENRLDVPVTKKADGEEYTLAIVIEEHNIIPLVSR